MTLEITVISKCIFCNKKYDLEETCVTCDECHEKDKKETAENAIREAFTKYCDWRTNNNDIPLKTEEENKAYDLGVERGTQDALFWVADYFNTVEFLEKRAETCINLMENKLNEH